MAADMVKHRLDNLRLYTNVSHAGVSRPFSRLFVLVIWFDGANPSRMSGVHVLRNDGASRRFSEAGSPPRRTLA